MAIDRGGLIEGLYESLITRELERRLLGASGLDPREAPIADADEPEVFARHVRAAVKRALMAERDPQRRLELVNAVLALLPDDDAQVVKPSQLLSAATPAAPGVTAYDTRRPATPLSDAALLTNAHGEPGIGAEVRAELPSADHVDAIIAFVKWYGLRVIEALRS